MIEERRKAKAPYLFDIFTKKTKGLKLEIVAESLIWEKKEAVLITSARRGGNYGKKTLRGKNRPERRA